VNRAAKKLAAFVAAAACATALAACKGKTAADGSQDVAAVVNGKNITLGEVDRIIREQTGGQPDRLSPLELGAARLQVLDELIKQEVLFQRADREKLLPTEDEITQAINTQKQQSRMTEEDYRRLLKESGQTEEALREMGRKQLAIKKLLDRVAGKINPPTDKEVEDFYTNNRARYVSARGVGLAAIVVDPADNGATNDAKGDIDAQTKINIINQRLKSGGDFADIARTQSEDPQTAQNSGDIGFLTEEQLKQGGFPDDLVAKLFSMEAGDITEPVKGSGGRWSIFKVTAKRLQAENLTLDNPQVRQDAADIIINQRKRLMNGALLEVAMREAKIENKLAESMLNSASGLSSLRPAGAPATPAPAQQPAASPAGSPAASPASNANAGK
jgi:parvulin-like peptidyl-prolyl isomerase